MDNELEAAKQVANMAKDPSSYSILTWAWVIWVSAWGGVVKHLNEIKGAVKQGKTPPVKQILFELSIAVITSSFVGVCTFLLCEASGLSPLWTAVCVAVTGHMGTEALNMLRGLVGKKMGAP